MVYNYGDQNLLQSQLFDGMRTYYLVTVPCAMACHS